MMRRPRLRRPRRRPHLAMPNPTEHAAIIAPPPLIYLAGLGVALLLDRQFPWEILPPFWAPLGAVLLAGGLLLVYTAFLALRRARTAASPYQASTAIVSSGPFRFSRNPVYLGMTFMYTGIGLWRNSGWVLLCLPPLLMLMHYGVIRREERYLAAKFGEAYLRYQARVRRWL